MFTEHIHIYQLSDGVLTHHHLYYHHYCYHCYLYYHYYDYYYCYYYRYYQWVHVMWSELCVNIQNSSGLYRWRGSNLNSWTFFDSHIKLIIFSFTSFLMFNVWICKWWKLSVREHRGDWNRQTADVKQWTHFKGMDRKVLSQHFETKSVFNSQISLWASPADYWHEQLFFYLSFLMMMIEIFKWGHLNHTCPKQKYELK